MLLGLSCRYLLLHGVCDVSKKACLNILNKSKSIFIAVGGGTEVGAPYCLYDWPASSLLFQGWCHRDTRARWLLVCARLLSPLTELALQSLYAKPGSHELVLNRRKGFVKIALQVSQLAAYWAAGHQ